MPRASPRKKRPASEKAAEDHDATEPVKRTCRLRSRTCTTQDGEVEQQEQERGGDISGEGEVTEGPSLSIQETRRRVQEIVDRRDGRELEAYMLELEGDARVGVVALVASIRESLLRQTIEAQRLETMMEYERHAYARYVGETKMQVSTSSKKTGKRVLAPPREHYLIGVDEVGVGPLAGPIVSCAVAFKYTSLLEILEQFSGIDDSKKLSAIKRESIAEVVKQNCICYNYGIVTAKEVDEVNPLQGSLIAMKRAIDGLAIPTLPSSSSAAAANIDVLVDHHTIPDLDEEGIRQTSITKGDSKSIVIAAASILAKVYRDEYMTRLHEQFPHFCFDKNAGYGTKDHLIQLRKGILCPEHRISFEPVRQAHRHSLGLPPDVSPKKATRAKSRSVSPVKATDARTKPAIGGSSIDAAAVAIEPPSLLSMAWWTRLFAASTVSQQR